MFAWIEHFEAIYNSDAHLFRTPSLSIEPQVAALPNITRYREIVHWLSAMDDTYRRNQLYEQVSNIMNWYVRLGP